MTVQKNQPRRHESGLACAAWTGWTQRARAGCQFMVGCAVLVFGSTRSFPGRWEQGAVGGWVGLPAGFASARSFSVSLPWASGGERDAAGVWVLRQRCTSLIHRGRERSEPVNNPLLLGNKPPCVPSLWWFQMFFF